MLTCRSSGTDLAAWLGLHPVWCSRVSRRQIAPRPWSPGAAWCAARSDWSTPLGRGHVVRLASGRFERVITTSQARGAARLRAHKLLTLPHAPYAESAISLVVGRGRPGKSTRTFVGTPSASVGAVALPSVEYTPRDPAGSVLQQIVREHFETFRTHPTIYAGASSRFLLRCGRGRRPGG